MATTIDYAGDYGGEDSDYQTTMAENPSATIDYASLARGKICPLKQGIGIDHWRECDGLACAWYDQTAERCAVLSLARNK